MAEKKRKGLVIVESPAKARKIGGYLGSDYIVMASMGHVRDLPASASEIPAAIKKHDWATMGVDVVNDFKPLYLVSREKKKVLSDLKDALKNCDELIVATDEDREGESIGWHLVDELKPKQPIKRMVFSEITKEAIQTALKNPRQIDTHLVSAQETRRILDRLYGYRLSPLLWKKVRPKLSAGRVQSVAVRMIVLREIERRAFRKGTFWDLKAALANPAQAVFAAGLNAVGNVRVASGKDFDEHTGRLKDELMVNGKPSVLLLDEKSCQDLRTRLQASPWTVAKLETRLQTRKPSPPFTTSTLQQEANRKLSLSARDTMRVAQRLYEEGYITYMRTDSVTLSQEAIQAARECVVSRYGDTYLHSEVRQYTTKSKGAQEAHEAIRPAGTEMKTGEELGLSGQELRLYSMIWKRTVATQMAEAQLRFQTATITAADAEFKATGRHVEFPGFFRAYVEGVDDPEAALDDTEAALPVLNEGDTLSLKDLESLSHETQPPARFTEATLIKSLESEAIGRPSTYASIISTIQDRGYVSKVGTQLRPTFTAMAVNRLLEKNFPQLVDFAFTASMEQVLDDIAAGDKDALPYLKQFYSDPEGLDAQVKSHEESIDPRDACTVELEGMKARVRIGRYGPYLVKEEGGESLTAGIPDDMPPADITDEMADKLIALKQAGPKSLGTHPEGQSIFVLNGPFGPYLQLGEKTEENERPKRVSIPKNFNAETLTLEQGLALLSLPRRLGIHPETGKVVNAGVGRFGPYVLHDKVYKSLGKEQDVLTIELPEAVELLKQARVRQAVTPLVELGAHPQDGEPVQVFEGRYGPYVKHGKVNATIPKDQSPQELTMAEAVALLQARAEKGGPPRKGSRRAAAPKKAAATPAAGAKTTTKRAAAKKTTKSAGAATDAKPKSSRKRAAS